MLQTSISIFKHNRLLSGLAIHWGGSTRHRQLPAEVKQCEKQCETYRNIVRPCETDTERIESVDQCGHICQAEPHDVIPTSLLEVGLSPFARRTSKSLAHRLNILRQWRQSPLSHVSLLWTLLAPNWKHSGWLQHISVAWLPAGQGPADRTFAMETNKRPRFEQIRPVQEAEHGL